MDPPVVPQDDEMEGVSEDEYEEDSEPEDSEDDEEGSEDDEEGSEDDEEDSEDKQDSGDEETGIKILYPPDASVNSD